MSKPKPPYPAQFRQQMIELARAGRTPAQLSREFGPTAQSIANWIAHDSDETYGMRRVRAELRDAGHAVSRKRVARLMQKDCIRRVSDNGEYRSLTEQ